MIYELMNTIRGLVLETVRRLVGRARRGDVAERSRWPSLETGYREMAADAAREAEAEEWAEALVAGIDAGTWDPDPAGAPR